MTGLVSNVAIASHQGLKISCLNMQIVVVKREIRGVGIGWYCSSKVVKQKEKEDECMPRYNSVSFKKWM